MNTQNNAKVLKALISYFRIDRHLIYNMDETKTKTHGANQNARDLTKTRPKSAAAMISDMTSKVEPLADIDQEPMSSLGLSPAVAHSLTRPKRRPYTAHPRYSFIQLCLIVLTIFPSWINM